MDDINNKPTERGAKREPPKIPKYIGDGGTLIPSVHERYGFTSQDGSEHLPTDESKKLAYQYSLAGMSEKRIAEVFNLSLPLFKEHYAADVKAGAAHALAEVMLSLHKEATGPNCNVKAANVYLNVITKTSAWKEDNEAASVSSGGFECNINITKSD
jgi:hypothetical protein